jgi:hypothetical protein
LARSLDRLRGRPGLLRYRSFRRSRRGTLPGESGFKLAPIARLQIRDQRLKVDQLLLGSLLQLRHRGADLDAEDIDLPAFDQLLQVVPVEDAKSDHDQRPHERAQIVENQAPELVALPVVRRHRRHRTLPARLDRASPFDRGDISRHGCDGNDKRSVAQGDREEDQRAVLRLPALPQAGSQSWPSTSAIRPPCSKNLLGT